MILVFLHFHITFTRNLLEIRFHFLEGLILVEKPIRHFLIKEYHFIC
jgi:hypothetical protein